MLPGGIGGEVGGSALRGHDGGDRDDLRPRVLRAEAEQVPHPASIPGGRSRGAWHGRRGRGAHPSQGTSPVLVSTRLSPGLSARAANSCAAALNSSAAAIRDSWSFGAMPATTASSSCCADPTPARASACRPKSDELLGEKTGTGQWQGSAASDGVGCHSSVRPFHTATPEWAASDSTVAWEKPRYSIASNRRTQHARGVLGRLLVAHVPAPPASPDPWMIPVREEGPARGRFGRSLRKFVAPATMLPPPVSAARRSAAGLESGSSSETASRSGTGRQGAPLQRRPISSPHREHVLAQLACREIGPA